MAYFPFSPVISPIAMPATALFIGMPASISERLEAQTLAIEVLPLELNTSETSLMVYGKSSSLGNTAWRDRSARAPCPISRRLGVPIRLASPVENGGKL